MNVGVILAGGVGKRAGAGVPKQFVRVFDKPLLAYQLEVYEKTKGIDAIEIVSHKDWIGEIERIVKDYSISKARWICTGGATFQESVMKGIFNLRSELRDEDIVVISVAISPMTPSADLEDSIRVCKMHGNAFAAKDLDYCTCLKDENDENSSSENILREKIKALCSPWTFRFGEICDAYEKAQATGLLETLEPHTPTLYFALGKRLYFSQSTAPFVKITTAQDIKLFKALVALSKLEESKQNGGGQ